MDLKTTSDFKPDELFQALGFDVSPSSSDHTPVSPLTQVALMAEKEYDLNICPIHPLKLELFVAKSNQRHYVRCPSWTGCGVFTPREKQNGYIGTLHKKLHRLYREDLLGKVKCQCNNQASLKISESPINPLRPFFTCRTRGGCPFFQWADVEFTYKNAQLQELLKDCGKF